MNSNKSNAGNDKMKTPYERRLGKYYFRKNIIFVILAVVTVIFLVWIKEVSLEQGRDEELTAAQILRVIDGDTIVVIVEGKEEVVRMIGVDSPESVSMEESENSIYGQYASDYTAKWLKKGQIVYLSFDEELRDPYERLLAYVWLEPDTGNIHCLYQNQLAEDGYALAVVYEPNSRYAKELEEAMQKAMAARKGLWFHEEFYNENAWKQL